jgi:hypothetical protein
MRAARLSHGCLWRRLMRLLLRSPETA